jgi:pyridoxamine 5'-phosphate oxidase
MNLADRRREYAKAELDEASVAADPFEQFQRWFVEAEEAELPEPHAMTLATADAAGKPSARIVLLKGIDAESFVFYTSYRSRKGRELAENPHAALVFYWDALERQVRVTGRVERLDEATSWAYFQTRPIGSRIGAWASHQSALLAEREMLERRVAELTREFEGKEIPMAPEWGGYRVIPDEIEFWQGRPSRLHDRIRFLRSPGSSWQRARLSP